LVSPHAAGPAAGNLARAADYFRRNLERYLAGEKLLNQA
jgi:phosphoglycerate dehydrogenase-like enzyme